MIQYTHDTDVVFLFCRLNMNTKKELPIRASEMGLLILASTSKQPVSPAGAAQYFNISKPMVTVMVRTLVREGYVEKEPSPGDGRSYLLVPTQKGRALVAETFDAYHATIALLKNNMEQGEYRAFLSLLKKANNILLEDKRHG